MTDTADIAVKPPPDAPAKPRAPQPKGKAAVTLQRAHRRDHQRLRRRRAALRPVARARSPRRWATASGRWRSSRPRSGRRRAASPARAATASASAPARVTNGGDETDLVVAFNEQVLLGRVRAGELKPGCTILLESMWRDDQRPEDRRRPTSRPTTSSSRPATSVHEIPMERECQDLVADARRGKNMFALGMLCSIYSLDLQLAREQIALTFGKKDAERRRGQRQAAGRRPRLGRGATSTSSTASRPRAAPSRRSWSTATPRSRSACSPRAWKSARCIRSRRRPRRRTI